MTKKQKEEIPIDTFLAGLAIMFRKMRARNIKSLGKGLESVKDMSQDELMKLDWELCILDMFIITYCCRLMINDEKMSDKIIDTFHEFVYREIFKDIDSTARYTFQEESNVKYKAYFEAMHTKDKLWNLCKEVGKNIFVEPFQSSIIMGALRIYIEGNQKVAMEYIKKVMDGFKLAEEKQ